MTSAFRQALLDILHRHPDGLKEHELIKALHQQGFDEFAPGLYQDSLRLFRCHFLLFNALYRLREQLLAEQSAILDIHTLSIRLLDYHCSDSDALCREDKLRDYYLDLNNLNETTLNDVEELLGDFWARFYLDGERAQAMQTLELAEDADQSSITHRYRSLAMQHHPDRGGDAETFSKIRKAYEVLNRA